MANGQPHRVGGGDPNRIEFMTDGGVRSQIDPRDAVWRDAPAAAAPSVNPGDAVVARYFRQDAAGYLQECRRFPSGAVIVVATQPGATASDVLYGAVVIQAATPSDASIAAGFIWIDITTPATPALKICTGTGPITFTDFTPPSPSSTVAALDGTSTAGTAATYSRGDHKHSDANRPTDGQKAALGGSSGTPSGLNPYVTYADPTNTNARTPTSHASSHQNGGGDEIATATAGANAIPKAGAGGTLAIGWIPTGTSSSTVCIGNDSRLSDARTPTAHHTSHQNGGSDEIATATAGANAIPKAGAGAKLAAAWISAVLAASDLTNGTTGSGAIVLAASPTLSGVVVLPHYYSPLVDDGNSGTTKTIDWNSGNEHKLTLTGNVTLTLSNPVDGGRYVILVKTGAGSFNVTWPGTVKWPDGTTPTITATGSKVDLVTMIYESSSTTYYAAINQNY